MSFQHVVFYNQYFMKFLAFVTFFTQLQLLNLLRYNKSISKLSGVLSLSATSLISFAVYALIIFMAFTSTAYLSFSKLSAYSSFLETVESLVQAMLGKFDFQDLVNVYGEGAGCFLLIYLLVIVMVILNMFMSILNPYFHVVMVNPPLDPDYQIMEHFLQTFKDLVMNRKSSGSHKHGNFFYYTSYSCFNEDHCNRIVYFILLSFGIPNLI